MLRNDSDYSENGELISHADPLQSDYWRRQLALLICSGSIGTAAKECIDGKCERCGFSQLWSEGLRPKVIDEGRDPPAFFKRKINWERLKAGAKDNDSAAGGGEDDDALNELRPAARRARAL